MKKKDCKPFILDETFVGFSDKSSDGKKRRSITWIWFCLLDILLTLQYEKPFDRLHRIHQLDSSEIRSSGYVVDTLEAALWAIIHGLGNRGEQWLERLRNKDLILECLWKD